MCAYARIYIIRCRLIVRVGIEDKKRGLHLYDVVLAKSLLFVGLFSNGSSSGVSLAAAIATARVNNLLNAASVNCTRISASLSLSCLVTT